MANAKKLQWVRKKLLTELLKFGQNKIYPKAGRECIFVWSKLQSYSFSWSISFKICWFLHQEIKICFLDGFANRRWIAKTFVFEVVFHLADLQSWMLNNGGIWIQVEALLTHQFRFRKGCSFTRNVKKSILCTFQLSPVLFVNIQILF